jgi:thymidylate synthase
LSLPGMSSDIRQDGPAALPYDVSVLCQLMGVLICSSISAQPIMAVGVPFNIASYALLLMMVANECKLIPGIFTHTFGDAHIYLDHLKGLDEQLKREPGTLPTVTIADKPVLQLGFDDFELHNYSHQGFIKFPVAV